MSARQARQPSPSQPPPHPGVVALAKALARLMVAEEDRRNHTPPGAHAMTPALQNPTKATTPEAEAAAAMAALRKVKFIPWGQENPPPPSAESACVARVAVRAGVAEAARKDEFDR